METHSNCCSHFVQILNDNLDKGDVPVTRIYQSIFINIYCRTFCIAKCKWVICIWLQKQRFMIKRKGSKIPQSSLQALSHVTRQRRKAAWRLSRVPLYEQTSTSTCTRSLKIYCSVWTCVNEVSTWLLLHMNTLLQSMVKLEQKGGGGSSLREWEERSCRVQWKQ